MKILFLLVSIPFLLAEQPHHTTAFIGPTETLISFSRYTTNHFWNKNGKNLPTYNQFKQNSYFLYSESPIDCANSAFINGGYSTVKESMNGTSQALKDIEIGWKHLLNGSNSTAFSFESTVVIPVGAKKSSIRYGKCGFQFGLLYSFFLNDELWIDTGLGYRFYEGFPSDQLRAFLSFGYQLPCFIFIATAETVCGLYNGDSNGNRNNIVFHANYRLMQTKMECVVTLMKHLSITLGAFYHLFGQNCGTGGGYFCGTWFIF